MAAKDQKITKFVICVRNDGYQASLEKRKIYVALEDLDAGLHRQVRVVDESGEDYLFPEEFFVAVELPKQTERAVIEAA